MLPLRQPGWVVVTSLGTSCSANISLTLICALCHAAGKSAAALKTENAPNGPLIRPPLAWDEASVAPEIVRTCREVLRSAGYSPLTISPFQTAGRCVSILLSMIYYQNTRSTTRAVQGPIIYCRQLSVRGGGVYRVY